MSCTAYVTVVVAKPEGEAVQLFRAPSFSDFDIGQYIIVESDDLTCEEKKKVAVVLAYEEADNNPTDGVIRIAQALKCDERWPLKKVLGVFKPLNWSDYDELENKTEEDN